jgi:hypothetical protein
MQAENLIKKIRNKGLDLWVPLKKVKAHMEYNFFG